ncbi:MAG TPA: hypothetical protein VFZ59_06810, partial [Verrucomicrobiae bacterium]|nr:hypothetical protein [Verrucomicrobiae bacterium]
MPAGVQILIAFLLGGGIGWLIGSLLARSKPSGPPGDQRLEAELRQQLSQRDSELSQLRSEVVSVKSSLATAQANQASAEKLLGEQRTIHDRV